MSLNDSHLQTLKALLVIGSAGCVAHFGIRGSFQQLCFRMLEIEEITLTAKLVLVSTG